MGLRQKNFKIFYNTQRFEPLSNFVDQGSNVNFQPSFQPYKEVIAIKFCLTSHVHIHMYTQHTTHTHAKLLLYSTGPPGSPTVTVSEVGVDSFTLTWTVPQPDIDEVCGPVQYNVTMDSITTTMTMASITYSELNHTTAYTIIVTPFNNAGSSPPANITVTTLTPSG